MSRVGILLRRGRDLALRWLRPGEVNPQWNDWNLYREIAWFGVLSGVSNTFISVFALRLGASNFLVGLRTSLPALINVIFQIPAARLVEREDDRRRVLLVSGFLMRLPIGVGTLSEDSGDGRQGAFAIPQQAHNRCEPLHSASRGRQEDREHCRACQPAANPQQRD